MSFSHEAWVLFFALFALYSPLAALPSYLPVIRGLTHAQMIRLSLGLWCNAAGFVILAIWVGEPLLELLGVSVAALTATGGIALGWEAVRLMLGHAGIVEELEPGQVERGEMPAIKPVASLRSILFMPVTFPLTVGGTTFAFGVAASADVGTAAERGFLTLAAICYGAVTGITIYLSGRLGTRISLRGALLADRLAGILLTAIAAILLANGFTDLVHHALHRLAEGALTGQFRNDGHRKQRVVRWHHARSVFCV
jgi:multiple antibiotic resistance protein